jgi:hypothetical protein
MDRCAPPHLGLNALSSANPCTRRPERGAPSVAGSVYRRCACREPLTGRQRGVQCHMLDDPSHGRWYYWIKVTGADGVRRRVRRGGFASEPAAIAARHAAVGQPSPRVLAQAWTVEKCCWSRPSRPRPTQRAIGMSRRVAAGDDEPGAGEWFADGCLGPGFVLTGAGGAQVEQLHESVGVRAVPRQCRGTPNLQRSRRVAVDNATTQPP